MQVWKIIYDRYCEGDFDIKPPLQSVHSEIRLKRLEENIGVVGEKPREKLEDEITKMCIDSERRGFYAALKIMLRLISE